MDRPTRHNLKGHQQPHRRSQSQHGVPGTATSTESENEEGSAVYESLTTAKRGRNNFVAKNPEMSSVQAYIRRQAEIADLLPSTNLDSSPRTVVSGISNRRDYSKSQLYELIRLSSETGSPETDDFISEHSEGHRISECPTVPVGGTGPYCTPSIASCGHQTGHYGQYGVQQLSALHLHNVNCHHPTRDSRIYFTTTDLDDGYLDKHASASSPTTSASDRCLLPASSSVNICKLSNKHHNCPGLISAGGSHSDRPLYRASGPSMSHHPTDLISSRHPLSEHYLANTARRSGQCPVHADGMLTNLRNHLRPGSTTKSALSDESKLSRICSWRNLAALMTLIIIALIATVAYYAVVVSRGKARQDELRSFRDANVIGDSSSYMGSSRSINQRERFKRSVENLTETEAAELSINSNGTVVVFNDTLGNETYPAWEYEPSVTFPGEDLSTTSTPATTARTDESTTSTPSFSHQPTLSTSLTEASVTIPVLKSTEKKKADDDIVSDEPRPDSLGVHLFSVMQTIGVVLKVDEKGRQIPELFVKSSKVIRRNLEEGVNGLSGRSQRDVKNNESWDPVDLGDPGFPGKDIYPNEDEIISLQIGSLADIVVPGHGFWIARLIQRADGYVSLNLTVPSSSSFVLYGRRDSPPKHSGYNFARLVPKTSVSKRSEKQQELRLASYREKLDAGVWFVGIYNDQESEEKVTFSIMVPDFYCPNDCNGHGSCHEGRCVCSSGFSGDDCSQVVCPLMCSGRGQYSNGLCKCNSGWKGADCSVPQDQCESPTCSSHGKCVRGTCVCNEGYSGVACENADCPKECLAHGTCVNGTCFCQPGWQGVLCQVPVRDARQLCSQHGTYDSDAKKCVCDQHWTGTTCELELCQPACSIHGRCENKVCVCQEGFTGPSCDQKACPPCGRHGKCSNGTCICDDGYSGRLCTINGCPNDCSGHGVCNKTGAVWKCQCNPQWTGENCNIAKEVSCADGSDNDSDGLVDCEDTDCCGSEICAEHANCITSPGPREVLLKEQAPADTAGFFDKVRFLIRENGVQSFVDRGAFDAKRAAVLRGTVTDSNNAGLLGVRVSVQVTNASASPWGFTISRKDGMFDLLLNGGQSYVILFQKAGYRQTTSTVILPWNDFAYMEQVKMFKESESVKQHTESSTSQSQLSECDLFVQKPSPHFYPLWKSQRVNAESNGASVHQNMKVLQESLNISGSDLVLNHFSSRTNGFQSLLIIELTGDAIPDGLDSVSIRVSNAGEASEATYDAEPDLKHLYSWNGVNAYRQQVFGFSQAKVSIGYNSRNCRETLWLHHSVQLKGMDLSVSDIGGWDLSVHHRFNTEGILHRGDGSNVIFSQGPLEVAGIIGNGQPRSGSSLGPSGTTSPLAAPVAVASAPDGTLYVGDYNNIIKLTRDGKIEFVAEIPSPANTQKYYLAVNPVNGNVYASLSLAYQIVRVANAAADPKRTFEVVAGNGDQCIPQAGSFQCGDGGSAGSASLIYPKGITFDKTGRLFVADGGAIRVVETNGIIKTLLQQQSYEHSWTPGKHFCSEVTDFSDLTLQAPTDISVDHVDDNLVVLDSSRILKLNLEHRKAFAIQRSSECDVRQLKQAQKAEVMRPISLTVGADGTLHVLEKNGGHWQLRRIEQNSNRIILSSCNSSACRAAKGKNSDDIQLPASLATGPDGAVYLTDLKALKVFRIAPAVPKLTTDSKYVIEDVERDQVYTFNEFGQHLRTNSLTTGERLYEFTYTADTAFGKLRSVSYGGKTVTLQRDYRNSVRSLDAGTGWKMSLTSTIRGALKDATYSNGYQVNFGYDTETGLINGRSDSAGRSVNYQYDKFGRMTQVTDSVGGRFVLPATDASMELPSSDSAANAIHLADLWISSDSSTSGRDHIDSLRLSSGNATVSFDLITQRQPGTVRRTLKQNGNPLWSSEYSSTSSEETLADSEGQPVMVVKRDTFSRPLSTRALVGDFAPSNFTYDSAGRLVKWNQGPRFEIATYNPRGQLAGTKLPNGALWKYDYSEKGELTRVTKPSGSSLDLEHDTVGGLVAVLTSKKEKLEVSDENMVLFRRVSVKLNGEPKIALDVNGKGQLVSVSFPSGLKTSHFVRDNSENITGIFAGRTNHQLTYDSSELVKKVTSSSESVSSIMERSYASGASVRQESWSFSGLIPLQSVSVSFDYDGSFNPVRRRVQVGRNEVSLTEFLYNPKTLQLRKSGPFSLSQSQAGALIVSDDNSIFLRQLNNMGKTRNVVLRIQQKIVASLEMSYNEMGQLSELRVKKRETDLQNAFSFKYDLDGQLTECARNKQNWFSFTYDVNGNLINSIANGKAVTIGYSSGDQLTAMKVSDKEVRVSTDADGFLTRKGDTKFSYNSFGLLDRAQKDDGSMDISYVYNHENRLIAIHNALTKEVTQYIYGGPGGQLTHVHHKRSLIQLFYDQFGQIIGLFKDGNMFYILHSPVATLIVDSQGQMVREMTWGPFGQLVADTNPAFFFPFLNKLQIRDENTGVLFGENSRPFDPEIGRYYAPDYGFVMSGLTLEKTNAYILSNNDPVLTAEERRPILEVEEWTKLFGISTGNDLVFDLMDFRKCSSGTSVKLAREPCSVQSVWRKFSTGTDRPAIANPLQQPLRISSPLPFYAKGLIISPEADKVQIYRTGTGSRMMNEMIESILEKSLVLPWTVSSEAAVKVFAVKKGDQRNIDSEFNRLRTAVPNLNVTKDLESSSMTIRWNRLVFVISYHADMSAGMEAVKKTVERDTVSKAWMAEKRLVENGESGLLWKWNQNEKESLLKGGAVGGFRGYLLRNVNEFPELSSDIYNVALTRA